ncbi:MAG: hypothetical protein KTR31_19155 [Myxococcales bacterium]|nr:hypothetical protein [Myxococcales bacterium]
MGFFDFLQPKPRCASCNERIYDEVLEWQGEEVCETCYLTQKAHYDQLEQRRKQEEAAREAVLRRQQFGPADDAR